MRLIESVKGHQFKQSITKDLTVSPVPFLSLLIVRWLMGKIRAPVCNLLCCYVGQFVDWFMSCSACHYKTNKKHLNGIGFYYRHLTAGNKQHFILLFCWLLGLVLSLHQHGGRLICFRSRLEAFIASPAGVTCMCGSKIKPCYMWHSSTHQS